VRGGARVVLALACAALVACARPAAAPSSPTDAEFRADYEAYKRGACTTSGECAFADPCARDRCIGRAFAAGRSCARVAPAVGECVCSRGECTLKPLAREVRTQAGCARDRDCGLDRAAGRCGAGWRERGVDVVDEGPICRCDAGACVLTWYGPIACVTHDDCSYEEGPRRPVSSSVVPRRSPASEFCQSACVDSRCMGGVCRVVGCKC
jgi:hypothetical protein